MVELFVKAPVLETPIPLIVNPSAVPNVNPFKSKDAPEDTTVPAAVVPNGVFVAPPDAPSFIVPSLIVVVPVYVFAPDKVKAVAPTFVKVKAPLITPLMVNPFVPVTDILALPVNVTGQDIVDEVAFVFNKEPAVEIPVPVISKACQVVILFPFKSNAPPEFTVTFPVAAPTQWAFN